MQSYYALSLFVFFFIRNKGKSAFNFNSQSLDIFFLHLVFKEFIK